MKAAVIHAYGSPDELKFEDMPDPYPGPGEVLIRTAATSINPLDVKMRSGAVKEYFPVSFPAILGWDVSGTVEKVGPGVKTFTKGDNVFAQTAQADATMCVVPCKTDQTPQPCPVRAWAKMMLRPLKMQPATNIEK